MSVSQSDALVIFGATGDLAFKMIFPSLYAMEQRGALRLPVIVVAKSDLSVEQFRGSAKKSIERHGGFDEAVFAKFQQRLQYLSGDFAAPATYGALRKRLGKAAHPLHYLAIPPREFVVVVEELGKSDCAREAHAGVEKPFGRDLPSAKALSATLRTIFDESWVFRINHYLGRSRFKTSWGPAETKKLLSRSATQSCWKGWRAAIHGGRDLAVLRSLRLNSCA